MTVWPRTTLVQVPIIDQLYRARVRTLNQELRPCSGRVRAALSYVATRSGTLSISVNQGGGFVRSSPERARLIRKRWADKPKPVRALS